MGWQVTGLRPRRRAMSESDRPSPSRLARRSMTAISRSVCGEGRAISASYPAFAECEMIRRSTRTVEGRHDVGEVLRVGAAGALQADEVGRDAGSLLSDERGDLV